MEIDLKITQLLCSRLCHDLIGSASAISAGLELIHEDPGDPAAPLGLMDLSAVQLSARLSFFRVAFGLAEGVRGPAEIGEMKSLVSEYLRGGKLKLHWPDSASYPDQHQLPDMVGKIILNLTLIASGCLPRGGEIHVHLGNIPEGTGIAVEAKGQGARLAVDIVEALAKDVNEAQLSTRNVHAYYAQCLSFEAGARIEAHDDSGKDNVQFAIVVPIR